MIPFRPARALPLLDRRSFLFRRLRGAFGLFQGELSEDRHKLVSGRADFGRARRTRLAQV